MAINSLTNKLVGIKEMEEIKKIIHKHMALNPFYKHYFGGRGVHVINDGRLVAGLVQFPLYVNVEKETTIDYYENARLLQKWLEHHDTKHGKEMISDTCSKLFAESIFLFRQIGRPPYFKQYKELVIKILSYDNESKQFLEGLLENETS